MLHFKFQGHREDCFMFLPHMGIAAILVMRPEPFEQTFVPPSLGGSTWNYASIVLAVSQEKKFGNVEYE